MRGMCEKKYPSCEIKNRNICSKLGDVSDFDKSDQSFIKKKGCCVEPNNICVHKSQQPFDGLFLGEPLSKIATQQYEMLNNTISKIMPFNCSFSNYQDNGMGLMRLLTGH